MVLLLLIRCWLLLSFWDSVIVLCLVVHYFMSIPVFQSSCWGRESWLLCFVCLTGVSWLLCGSSSRCHGFVCSLWLWYFLIILNYYFLSKYPIRSKSYEEFHYLVTGGRTDSYSDYSGDPRVVQYLNKTICIWIQPFKVWTQLKIYERKTWKLGH